MSDIFSEKNIFKGNFFWSNPTKMYSKSYICGFCNDKVSSDQGYGIDNFSGEADASQGKGIYICPSCKAPTYFSIDGNQIPGILIGNSILDAPKELESLYTEARNSYSVGAYTGTVLLARKMLMNLAVSLGDKEGKAFYDHISFLSDNHYIPKSSESWVDYIRKQGNEATHKVKLKTAEEAETLLKFIEMLLKIHFEYPAHISSDKNDR